MKTHNPAHPECATVRTLTDSILSICGDVDQPNTWAQYVSATQRQLGTSPTGAAHSKTISPEWERHWLLAFGIVSRTPGEIAQRKPESLEASPGTASGMFCAP